MPDTSAPDPITTLAAEVRRLSDALDARGVDAEGLSPQQAAAYLGISAAKIHQLNADGLIPAPAQMGTGLCPRYSRTELRAWLLANCPDRSSWARQREVMIRRVG